MKFWSFCRASGSYKGHGEVEGHRLVLSMEAKTKGKFTRGYSRIFLTGAILFVLFFISVAFVYAQGGVKVTPVPNATPPPSSYRTPPPPMGSPVPPPPSIVSSEEGTSSQDTTNIPLILQIVYISLMGIILVLLLVFYYRNYVMSRRLHHLEVLMEKQGGVDLTQDEPIPFSWEKAVKSLERGWSLFGDKGVILHPGVVVIVPKQKNLGFHIASNLIYQMVSHQKKGVVYLSKTKGENDLGKSLLAIESGVSIEDIPKKDREVIIQRYSLEMGKYEQGLFVLRDFCISLEEMYRQVMKLSEKIEMGLIIVDGKDVLKHKNFDELISKLRLISVKTYTPVVLIDVLEDEVVENISESSMDRIVAFLRVDKDGDVVKFSWDKFIGVPPYKQMKIDSKTGEMTPL